jgi:concanavalin A-like lectin/glucanase superfamily protein
VTHDHSLRLLARLSLGALLFLATAAAFGQPYNAWLTNTPGHGYVQLPSASSLNFSGGSFTFEAWIAITDSRLPGAQCSSIAGNDYVQSSWIGVCGTTLRSYLQGAGSLLDGGTIPANNWTHIAITFDAATKKHTHYIDGEKVAERVDGANITASSAAWRIYSDTSWQFSPNGGIDEVRFWNVARTLAQIRNTITTEISGPTTGLVAQYKFNGNSDDSIGSANGTKTGATANYFTSAIGAGCTTSPSTLCVGTGGRFSIQTSWKTVSSSGNGTTASFTTSESGLFTFFSPTNVEMVVKVLNACGVNNRFWVFAGGLTDQHVEMEVTDITHGVTKRYFNYLGTPFAPINDIDAFATCP